MGTRFSLNGRAVDIKAEADTPLLWVIRDEVGLTGTKFGCGVALCGACTVLAGGMAIRSCVTPLSAVEGNEIVTIEGLSPDGMHPLQVAWRELNVPQCGYCQAGQIMNAASLLKQTPHPSDAEIREQMSGNICRCGCYTRIVAAVRNAATGT